MKKQEDLLFSLKENFEILREVIEREVPSSKIILKEKDWEKIHKHFYNRYRAFLNAGVNVMESSCFVEMVIGSYANNDNKDSSYKVLLNFVNKQIEKAFNFVSSHSNLKNKLEQIIREMMTTMDVDANSNNSDFKNRLNELFVFNTVSSNPKYEIINMEERLDNGKSVDYLLVNKETREQIYMDVVTMQNIDPTLHESSDSFNNFLNKRLIEKYNSKLHDCKNKYCFRVLPVIEFHEGMEKFDIDVDKLKAFQPLSVMRNRIENNEEILLSETMNFIRQIRQSKNLNNS